MPRTKKNNGSGTQQNQSIIDGIKTLQALAVSEEPVGCRELSRQLGFDVTRTNRILKTLATVGIATQLSNKKYTGGPGLHVLAAQSLHASGLLRKAFEPLEQLASFGFVVALGVLWRDSVSYLYHRQPGMVANEAIGRIGLRSATLSGIGIALLSQETESSVRELFAERPIPGFPDGIDALLTKLAESRSQGYANVVVEPERRRFVGKEHRTIAVPEPKSHVYAVALSGWIPKEIQIELVENIKDTIDAIQQA